jgi:hypothetical protein
MTLLDFFFLRKMTLLDAQTIIRKFHLHGGINSSSKNL